MRARISKIFSKVWWTFTTHVKILACTLLPILPPARAHSVEGGVMLWECYEIVPISPESLQLVWVTMAILFHLNSPFFLDKWTNQILLGLEAGMPTSFWVVLAHGGSLVEDGMMLWEWCETVHISPSSLQQIWETMVSQISPQLASPPPHSDLSDLTGTTKTIANFWVVLAHIDIFWKVVWC